jgi:protein-histidine pros-kinase
MLFDPPPAMERFDMETSPAKLNELTFHLILESTADAVVVVNTDGRIAYANRQCEALLGYGPSELIGRPVETLLPEALRERHVGLRSAFLANPSRRTMGAGLELTAVRKDGSVIAVEIGLNPLVLVEGTWVVASIVDVTARKRDHERLLQVVQAAPNAIILVDRHGEIVLVNAQAVSMFGYSVEEMVGRKVEMLVPEALRERHPAWRDGFFAQPHARMMGSGRELCARRKDGSAFPAEIGLNPIDPGDNPMALVSVVDITERLAQQELRTKKEAAEAAYKAKSEMLAVASHDLKNPLTAINGLAELMLEAKRAEPGCSPEDLEFLQTIYDASRHMSNVVKGILANEGLEQQGLHLSDKPVDLSDLCHEIVRFNEVAAHRKHISMAEEISPQVCTRGDPTRLREAFDNYVSNAIKYSPPGKSVTVCLALVPGEGIRFGVRDQGPGLSAEDKAKAFGKFRKLSARPTAGESSTGLGLSIVKAIVEMHGGAVGCESEPGQGAYFWARLPQK